MKSELPEKQAAFVRINAWRQIARHIGLIPPHVGLTPSAAEYRRRQEQYAETMVVATSILCQDDATEPQKAAAGVLLDCIFPEWRERFPREIVGPALDRNAREVKAWRKVVLERDGHKCTSCGGEKNLEAHHILPWAVEPRLRIVVENGLTLCQSCHLEQHRG